MADNCSTAAWFSRFPSRGPRLEINGLPRSSIQANSITEVPRCTNGTAKTIRGARAVPLAEMFLRIPNSRNGLRDS